MGKLYNSVQPFCIMQAVNFIDTLSNNWEQAVITKRKPVFTSENSPRRFGQIKGVLINNGMEKLHEARKSLLFQVCASCICFCNILAHVKTLQTLFRE